MKTRSFLILVITINLFFINCIEKTTKDFNNNPKSELEDEVRVNIIKNYSISSLQVLWYQYIEIDQVKLILPDAFYLATVNNDPLACYLIFEGYIDLYFPKKVTPSNKIELFYKLPIDIQNRIMFYLEKGANQKFFACIDTLIKIYEFKNDPKAIKYKSIKDKKYIEDFYKKPKK
jgi:hypothetical protein